MTVVTLEAPDINAPYPAPPYSCDEYCRRLELAIPQAECSADRISLENDLKALLTLPWTEEAWREWFLWNGRDLDEAGRKPAPQLPPHERTAETVTDAELAERIGWTRQDVEREAGGIGTNAGMWLREGDDCWRFFVKLGAVERMEAAE